MRKRAPGEPLSLADLERGEWALAAVLVVAAVTLLLTSPFCGPKSYAEQFAADRARCARHYAVARTAGDSSRADRVPLSRHRSQTGPTCGEMRRRGLL